LITDNKELEAKNQLKYAFGSHEVYAFAELPTMSLQQQMD
jgi:hypothetical protein